ncbi:hypothetical protein AK88_04998 [Plasmodium fragile]|uniref:Uncharacterized protein n=1 Tax=Plasmodium fragile TaxID=5857 RepID=A0A0D9QI23_PLAFR|nr:uncharacterized protein AK88_04998 [Plasmodium fragile]KJP85371.1 hypothetical protein AK88_04998 [Plasmodium fragile]
MTARSIRNHHAQLEEEESGSREANAYWQQVNSGPNISITELDPWEEEDKEEEEEHVRSKEGGHTDGERTWKWDATNMIMVSEAKSLSSRGLEKKNPLKKTEMTPCGKAKNDDAKRKEEDKMESKKKCVRWEKNRLATSNGTLLVGIHLGNHLNPRLAPCLSTPHEVKKKNKLGEKSVEAPSVRKITTQDTHNLKGPLVSELKRGCKMVTMKGWNKTIMSLNRVKECVKDTKNCKSSFVKKTISRVATPHPPFHCVPLRGETKWKKSEQGFHSRSVHRRRTPIGKVKSIPKVKPQIRTSVKSATSKGIEPTKIKHVVKKPPSRMNPVAGKGEQRGGVGQRMGSVTLRRNITGREKMHLKRGSCGRKNGPLAGGACCIRMRSRRKGEISPGCPRREKGKMKERGRENEKGKSKTKENGERGKGEQNHSSATVRSRIEDKRQELLCSVRERLSGGTSHEQLGGSGTGGRVPVQLEREMRCGVMNTHVYTYVGSQLGAYGGDAPEEAQQCEKESSSLLHPPLSSNTYQVGASCVYDHVTNCEQGRERSHGKINTWSSDDDIMMGTVPSSSGTSIQGSKSITWIGSRVNEAVVRGKRRSHSLNAEQESRSVNPLILTNDLRIKICYSNNYADLRRMGGLLPHERVAPGAAEDHVGTKVKKESSKRVTHKVPKYVTEAEPQINYSQVSYHSDDHLNISDDLFLISQDSEKMKSNGGYLDRINLKEIFDRDQGCCTSSNSWEGQKTECHTCMEGNMLHTFNFVNAENGTPHLVEQMEKDVSCVRDVVGDEQGAHGLEGDEYIDLERTNEQCIGWCTPQLGQHEMENNCSHKNRAPILKGIDFNISVGRRKKDNHILSSGIKIKKHSLWTSAHSVEQDGRSDDEGERQTDENTNDAHISDHTENLIAPCLGEKEEEEKKKKVYINPFTLENGSNSTSASLWECPSRNFINNSHFNYLVSEESHRDSMMKVVEDKVSGEVSLVPCLEPKEKINNKFHINTSGGRNKNEAFLKLVGISQMKGTTLGKLKKNFKINHPCGGVSTEGEETLHEISNGDKRDTNRFEQHSKSRDNFPFEKERRGKIVKKKGSDGVLQRPHLHTEDSVIGRGVTHSTANTIGTKSTDTTHKDKAGYGSPTGKEERKKKKKKKKENEKIVKKKNIVGQKKRSQSTKTPQHCEKIFSTKNQGKENTYPLDASTVQTNGTSKKVAPHVGNNTQEAACQPGREKAQGRSGLPAKSSSSLVNHNGDSTWSEKKKKKKKKKVKRNSCQIHHYDKGNIKDEEKKKKKIPSSYAVLQMLIRKKRKKGLTKTDGEGKTLKRVTCNLHKCDVVVGRERQGCVFSPQTRNSNFKARSGCSVALCGAVPGGKTKKKGKTQKGSKGVKRVRSEKGGGLRKVEKEWQVRMKDEVLLATQDDCFANLANGIDCGDSAPKKEKRARDAKEANNVSSAMPNSESKTTSPPSDIHQEGGRIRKTDSTPGGQDPPESPTTNGLEKIPPSKVRTKMSTKRSIRKREKGRPCDEAMKDGTAISFPSLRNVLLTEDMQRSAVPERSHFLGQSGQEVSVLEELIQKGRCQVEVEKERSIRRGCEEWTDEARERTSIGIEPETVHTVKRERSDKMEWMEEMSEADSLGVDGVEKFHQTFYEDKLDFPLGGLSGSSSCRSCGSVRRREADLQHATGGVPRDYAESGSAEEGRRGNKGNDPTCGKFSFSLNLEKYVADHRINQIHLKRSLFGGNQEGEHIFKCTSGCDPDLTECGSALESAHMGKVLIENPHTRTIEQIEGSNVPPQRRRQITWGTEETNTRNVKPLFFKCNERQVMNARERKSVTNDLKQDVPHFNMRKDAYPDEEEGKGCLSSPCDQVMKDQDCSSLRFNEGGIELGLFSNSKGCASFGEKGDGDGSPSPHSAANGAKCIPSLLSRTKSLVFRRGRSDCDGGTTLTEGVAIPNGGRSMITKMTHHVDTLDEEGSLFKKKKITSGSSRSSLLLPKRDVAVRTGRVNIFRRAKSCSILKGNVLERDCAFDVEGKKWVGKSGGTATMARARTPVGQSTKPSTALKRSALTCRKTLGESHAIHKSLVKGVQTQTSGCLWRPCFLFESGVKE